MDIREYLTELQQQLNSGVAREHAYRPALKTLFESTELVTAINDPQRSEHGNPDFIFQDKQYSKLIRGYGESKDINISLDVVEKSEQMRRYYGYSNLVLTNGLDFRFFKNGEKYFAITLGFLENNKIVINEENLPLFWGELKNFLQSPPEKIRSAVRLSEIMGGKARRIRENINLYLKKENNELNVEIEKIYKVITDLLVHDLTIEKFADMYAQTLVYGLFIARYHDKTVENFTRQEARDLVPASNPFLRQFFDHIAGPQFDKRLSYIVDELCAVFQVSDIKTIIKQHFKQGSLLEDEIPTKDPIIHFYEDFLKEYDPDLKKKMGAYYTPIPVVRYMVKAVDDILKTEFGLAKGLADTSRIKRKVKNQGLNATESIHRVQILDPAVGTATFLNELVKYIFENNFKGQEGRWTSYVEEDLIPRLYGFELMMAPYTIAHLKLAMTLKELGYNKEFDKRLGIYLTNTLEEGIKSQLDLLTFGLQDAISKESQAAAEIKHNRPIMVIIGNPPYSVSSSNKSIFIENLMKDYKKNLNEKNVQPLSDDYIKFIRFAQDMIDKNGDGIVAMITNNSFVDGIIHRQMRKCLMETFDQIYILDLHGNSKKKERTPDGSKDENVFNIQQGVSINIFIKHKGLKKRYYFSELFGKRDFKFKSLLGSSIKSIDWKVCNSENNYLLNSRSMEGQKKYDSGFAINELFYTKGSGIKFRKDSLLVRFSKEEANKMVDDVNNLDSNKLLDKYNFNETDDWKINDKRCYFDEENSVRSVMYRPFDVRYTYYPINKINHIIVRGDSRRELMSHLIQNENIAIVTKRGIPFETSAFITNTMADMRYWSCPGTLGTDSIFPLYTFKMGKRESNINDVLYRSIIKNISKIVSPEDIFDYIYAILYSKRYNTTYTEFLRVEFPRIPFPKNEEIFWKLVKEGKKLRETHLMLTSDIQNLITTFSISGSNLVQKIKYEDERVYINDQQYFGNVPDVAWNFYIGGYQPAQKWLKDRKGRVLSNDDIEHYQKIVKVLCRTNEIMAEIDNVDFM
jgi:predicted helicase